MEFKDPKYFVFNKWDVAITPSVQAGEVNRKQRVLIYINALVVYDFQIKINGTEIPNSYAAR